MDKLQCGILDIGNYNRPNWGLEKGTGDRNYYEPVNFTTKFNKVPTVTVNLRGLDVDHRYNTRCSVNASDVTEDGFKLRVTTWGDTRLYAVFINWTAIS